MYSVKEFDRNNNSEKEFILEAFNSDDSAMFWSLKKHSYNFSDALFEMLDKQLGEYKLYICYDNISIGAFFIAHSISSSNRRAELTVFVAEKYRKKGVIYFWWVLFLKELQNLGIEDLYGKVFDHNTASLVMAEKNGFAECGLLPRYIKNGEEVSDVTILHRLSFFEKTEKIWYNRISCIENSIL